MKSTYNSLLSRGIDSTIAKKIIDAGYTIEKLKNASVSKLNDLGLSDNVIQGLYGDTRPPIPEEIISQLLYDSRITCCICRTERKGFIIHHIEEWSKTRNHSESNLVLLCLNCHDLVHTTKQLSKNIHSSDVKVYKEKWLADVKTMDSHRIIGLSSNPSARWDYFNHQRIFELFIQHQLSNKSFKTTKLNKDLKLINTLGFFEIIDTDKNYFYNSSYCNTMYLYMHELFSEVLKIIPLLDISNKFSILELQELIRPGVAIAILAPFYFKNLKKLATGKGQTRRCFYNKNGVKIEFHFDAFEATSNSAWCDHLTKYKSVTAIGYVTSVINEIDKINITISCLAIGSYLDNNQFRNQLLTAITTN